MRVFGKKLRLNRRGKNKSVEPNPEDVEEQCMRDLEETLAQHSAFVILRGDKLRRYQARMEQLTKVFQRTAVVPVEKLTEAKHYIRHQPSGSLVGSSRLDSAHDIGTRFPHRHFHSLSSHDSDIPLDHVAIQEGALFAPVAVSVHSESDTPMYSNKQSKDSLEESEASEEDIPVALLSSSVHGESTMPDTATTEDAGIHVMNDWKQFQPLTSFTDFQTPPPMRVSHFVDLQTQDVVSSRNDRDRSPLPQTPEKDRSTTDGLLFAADSHEMLQSARASTISSSDVDSDAYEGVLSRLREDRSAKDRKFRASRVSISPNFPVNVWDDVAPTRLHAHLINISMDQDHNLLPVP